MELHRQAYRMKFGAKEFDLSSRTHVMGILNVTPDSFSDGGKYITIEKSVVRALQMVEEGADIIDIGGESTRPKGAYGSTPQPVSAEEEMDRVIPVIREIVRRTDTPISIDTYKSSVAEEALKSGASIVNDISGLRFDPAIAGVAARYGVPLVVMHIQGTPATMQENPTYTDVVAEIKAELTRSVFTGQQVGVNNIIIDPGIGFGKNLDHNLTLMKHLSVFHDIGCPLLIGTSRKGFIGALLDLPVDQRVEGTGATVAVAIMNGVHIIRVHDVKEMKRVAVIVDAIKHAA